MKEGSYHSNDENIFLHRDIFFLYMGMHIDYNILYVQHNHNVDIDNLDKQIPLKYKKIMNIFCN